MGHPPIASDAATEAGRGFLESYAAPSRGIYRHPQANREVTLGHERVAYLFRRAKRKTIGFMVGPDGLVVSAPRWVLVGEVDAALQEKARWIERKLQEVRERQERMQSNRIEWRDGTTIPFLGEQVVVVIDPRIAGAQLKMNETAEACLPGIARHTLHVGVAHNASAEQLRDAVQAWLMRQAKRLFAERMAHFAKELHVQPTRLTLSSAGTRWGSASADGAIRLNWRLIHFDLANIDYVVVHELSHLRVMDHSPQFWSVVGSVLPDYAVRRGALRDDAIPKWD